MNKLIVEEINRVREIMGLSLLTESIIAPNFWKLFLNDISLLAKTGARSIDNISRIPQTADKIKQIEQLMDGINKSSDNTVKIFRDSLNGVASKYNKNALDLYKNIVESKLDGAIAEEIMVLMSKKMDDTFKALLSKRLKVFNEQVEVLILTINQISKKLDDVNLEQTVKNDLRRQLNNVEMLMSSLSEGPLKRSLLDQIDEITQKLSKNTDEASEQTGKQTDEVMDEIENVRFNQEDLNQVQGIANSTKPIEGDLADYLSKKFKMLGFDSWKRFSVDEQNRIILEMSAKINSSFEKTISEYKWEAGLVAANKTIQQLTKGNLSEKVMETVFRNAINTAKPSFGTLGNVLDGLVEFTTGLSARQGKIFWTTTTGWGEITKKWILFNLALAAAEGTLRFWKTREEPTPEGLINVLEQRVDFIGLAQRLLLPLPLIQRLIVSETVQAGINSGIFKYDGFRQLTESQTTEKFGPTNVEKLDVSEFPCYGTFQDKLKGFSTRANYFKVSGQNKGIWALDLSTGEVVQIQTPMSDDCTTPLVSTTITPAKVAQITDAEKEKVLEKINDIYDSKNRGFTKAEYDFITKIDDKNFKWKYQNSDGSESEATITID